MTSAAPDPFAHRPRRPWRRVIVEVPAGLVDAAADIVAEVSGAGVEITMALPPAARRAARERVIGYLAGDDAADEQEALLRGELAALAARGGARRARSLVRSEPLLEEDWGAGWKEHFHPFHVAPLLVIKPLLGAVRAAAGRGRDRDGPRHGLRHRAAREHPARARASSRRSAPARRRSARWTSAPAPASSRWPRRCAAPRAVIAIDNDPDAVAAARENVARNGLAGRVRVSRRGPGRDRRALRPDRREHHRRRAARRWRRGWSRACRRAARWCWRACWRGSRTREVRAAYEGLGLLCAGERGEGEWAALLLIAAAGRGGLRAGRRAGAGRRARAAGGVPPRRRRCCTGPRT